MKRDLPGAVSKVADSLDVHVSVQALETVVQKSSFEYMKQIDENFRMWKMIRWHGKNHMLRKGAQGGSSELLGLERQGEIDAHLIEELNHLRSDFPYEECCDIAPGAEREAAVHA